MPLTTIIIVFGSWGLLLVLGFVYYFMTKNRGGK